MMTLSGMLVLGQTGGTRAMVGNVMAQQATSGASAAGGGAEAAEGGSFLSASSLGPLVSRISRPIADGTGLSIDLVQPVMLFAIKAILALLLLIVAWIVSIWAKRFMQRVFAKTELDETLERFVANAVKWVVLAIGVLMCLETFGVNATGLVAMLTALSVAIGLALQGSLSHFASGVMLLIFRPFKVNDDVTVAGTTGKVDSIDLFTTTILTNDNDTVIIPNGQIFGSVIRNHTPEDARMVSVTVNIRGDASSTAVRAALTEAGARAISRSEHALKKPGPSAQLQDFAGPQAWQVKVFCQPGHIEEVREVLWLEVRSTVAERDFGPPPSVQMVRQVT